MPAARQAERRSGARSGRPGAGANDRTDVLAAQRSGEPAGHESVHDLHALDMARGRHDLEQRAIERQRALVLCELVGAALAEQLRLLAVGPVGIGGVHPIHVLDDREARRSECIGDQKRAGVGPVNRDARVRELVVMIRREGAPDDRAGGGEVNGELARDGRVLDVGDALWCEQKPEDVAILAGLAGGKRGERPDRQAEIETDAVDVARANAGAGQNEQAVLRQQIADLLHERKDRLRAAIHDGAATDLHDLQPGENLDRTLVGDRAGELAVKQRLARKRRDNVLDVVGSLLAGSLLAGSLGHGGHSLSSR